MASPPFSSLRLNYLTTLHDRATHEIEARKPVELESQDTPEVVPPLIDVTISPIASGHGPDTPDDPSAHRIFTSLAEAFAHHAGRLVLLGCPGSGKTTTLWMFARERTEACLADPTQPLPIFLKIDTWNRKTPIAEWVRSQMPNLPLQNVPLLYLCDGLDELGGERPVDPAEPEGERFDPRADFLRLAETQFTASQFVISCRSAEYEQIRSKMHGCGAVTLLPLDEEKIEEFLASWDRPRLWATLRDDPNLMELARTPLLLSLLTSAIGADGIDTEQDLQHLNESTLFRFYFDRRFTHEERKFQANSSDASLSFDKATTRQLLGKLALYMWHWPHDPLTAVDRIEAQFHLGAHADAFLAFACRMHFLRESPDGHIAFIHLKFRDFCVVPVLQQVLEDGSDKAQELTFNILVHLKEQGVATLLQAAEQSKTRQKACSRLAELAQQTDPALQSAMAQGIPIFRRLLHGSNNAMDWSVMSVLVRLGAPAVPTLLQRLQNEDAAIRYSTASAIAYVSPRVAPDLHEALALAIPTLMEALRSNGRRKRWRLEAAGALAELAANTDPLFFGSRKDLRRRGWRAITADDIEGRRKTSSPDGRPNNPTDPWLCEALSQTVPTLVAALKERDPQVHEAIIDALYYQRERALPGLLSALQGSDPDIRSAAISILTRPLLQTDDAVQEAFLQVVTALLQDLNSRETGVRRTAVADLLALDRATTQTKAAFRKAFQQAIPGLLKVLFAKEKEIRLDAASLLSRQDISVVSILLPNLENGEVRVRRQAAAILAQLAVDSMTEHRVELKQSLPALLRALQDTDAKVRKSVTSVVTRLSLPPLHYGSVLMEKHLDLTQSVPELLEAIRNRERRVRSATALILALSGDQSDPMFREVRDEIVPILLEVLQREDYDMRSAACLAIRRLATQADPAFQEAFFEFVPAFLRKIKRKGLGVQHNAGVALAALGPSIIPVLLQALQEEDVRVRHAAVIVLAQLSEEAERSSEVPASAVFAALLQALNDREPYVRAAVASTLSRLGAEAIPPLLQALRDRDGGVQREAISSFADLNTVAVPALLQALHAEEIAVRRGAASALSKMKTMELEWRPYPVERALDPELQSALKQAVPVLRQALQDPDAGVREEILSLLVYLEKQSEPLLLEMLEDEALSVRCGVVKHLGYRRATIPALLHLLQSDRHATRWAAMAALYEHGYVPRLALRPRVHVVLRHRLDAKSSATCRRLLTLLMRTSFLQRLPILFSQVEK